MSQESLVFFSGILVLVTPLLGFPHAWKDWGIIVLGAFIVIVGYRLRRAAYLRSIETDTGDRRADAFVENNLPRTPRTSDTEVST